VGQEARGSGLGLGLGQSMAGGKAKTNKTAKKSAKSAKSSRQVAALPVRTTAGGDLEILVITSRRTGRFIIPKGWPMKGRSDDDAAAIEAREEAGLVGKVGRKPIGSYTYWKRLSDRFRLVKVHVYLLKVSRQLEVWQEKKSRHMAWLSPADAALLVDEPQLIAMINKLRGSTRPG
jgi:8-oxo-dGTP pyrophosphatase MutT (NUDIX family)